MERADPEIERDFKERGIIPPQAHLFRATGDRCEVSLSEEYQPTPERAAAFMKTLKDLEDSERQAVIDSIDVRLQ